MKRNRPAERVPERVPHKAPAILDLVGECRAPLEAAFFWFRALNHPFPRCDESQRKTVMMIPGFMAGDYSLYPLRSFVERLGHQAHFTGIWANSNCPRLTLERLYSVLSRLCDETAAPVSLIGHSLGGIYAREIASRWPDMVERVITFGSPISEPRASSHV